MPVVKDINGETEVEYTYNHYGNMTSMTDSEGQSVSCGYDDLQRLASVNTDGFSKSFTYTDGLPSLITYKLDNTVIASERRGYSCGTLSRVTLGDTTVIWQLDAQNGRGLPSALSNSAMETALDYDGDNRVIDRYVTLKANSNIEVSSQLYNYNGATGNMTGRGVYEDDEEEFTYDALQRLTGYGGKTIAYDLIGNIVQKSDIGALEYDGTPYAFTFLTDTAMVMPATTQTIAYNALQLPDTIDEGGYRATFMYYGDGTRSRMTLGNNNGTMQVRYYDGQFNRYHRYEGNIEYTKDILWLGGTPYTAPAALMRVSDGPTPSGDNWRLYYVVRDNMGSVVAVTDSAGNILQALRYDPWGNIVDNSDGHLLTRGEQPELLLERGYTGHEHLPQFGLINMNARLYEPLTARFLSPDPEVQAPDFSQNLNRYSYCLNNPLRYIDPTGEIVYETNDPDEIQRLLDWFKVAGYTQPIDVVADYISERNGWNTYESDDEVFTLLFSSASSSYYYSGSGSVSGMNFLPEITVNGWRTIIPKSDFPNGDDYYNNLYHSDLWNGFTSATLSHIEKYFKGNGWSYIIMNSKNELTPKIYTKRFYGNQYVKPTKFSTVAEKTGHYFAYISAISSAYDCYNSYTTEEYTVRTIDFVFSLLGCSGNKYAQIASTAWSLGGKDLFWITAKAQRDMSIEQEKLGIIGLPAVQAFK